MMKKRWFLLVLIIVFFSPWLFTRPYLFGWEGFDFSQTGSIGDTIGGITAPIVGLVSIVLLWLTLKAQLDYNKNQDRINQEQQILSLETHIIHLDENLHFAFSGFGRSLEGRGISSLRLLSDSSGDISIAKSELDYIIDRVHIIETAVCSMVSFIEKTDVFPDEIMASIEMADMYLLYIKDFYDCVSSHRIKWFLSLDELDSNNNIDDIIISRCISYRETMKPAMDICNQRLSKV